MRFLDIEYGHFLFLPNLVSPLSDDYLFDGILKPFVRSSQADIEPVMTLGLIIHREIGDLLVWRLKTPMLAGIERQ